MKDRFIPGDLISGLTFNLEEFSVGIVIKYYDQVELEDLHLLTNDTAFLNGKWLEALISNEMRVVNESWCKKHEK